MKTKRGSRNWGGVVIISMAFFSCKFQRFVCAKEHEVFDCLYLCVYTPILSIIYYFSFCFAVITNISLVRMKIYCPSLQILLQIQVTF